MSHVEFEEEYYPENPVHSEDEGSRLIGFLVEKGWARDQRQAQIILWIIFTLCMIITLAIILWPEGDSFTPQTSEEVYRETGQSPF